MNTQKKDMAVCILFALIFATGFFLCVFFPKSEYSYSERRSLASPPVFSASAFWSGRFMSDFEAYAVDHIPFREQLRMFKALTAKNIFRRQDNNGIYLWNGFLTAMEYPLNEDSLNRAIDRFRYVCEKYFTENNNVFFSVIPDKNACIARESGHPAMDYALFEALASQKADFAEYIKISDLLESDDYYKTDTHWRQERITDVAERLARAMDAVLSQDYEIRTLEHNFYGVYYGQAALPLQPDSLQYLTGKAIENCIVFDLQNNREISVYDLEKAKGKDPYEMFLSGSLSLITIDNPDAPADKQLVIFRDSFGSSIAPLFISGYSKITLADIRYVHPDLLGQFVDFENCDILFLYSTLVLNHSETLK